MAEDYWHESGRLPLVIQVDEKRLRQVLINHPLHLLADAIDNFYSRYSQLGKLFVCVFSQDM